MQTISVAFTLIFILLLAIFPANAGAQSLTPAQRADLRKMRNIVIEAENQISRMEMAIAEWKRLGSQVGDKRVADFNGYNNAFADAYRQGADVASRLPAGDPTVDDLVNRLNAALPKYNKLTAEAKAILEGAQQAVEDMGGREQIQEDIDRIDAIAYQFAPFDALMLQFPAEALELLGTYQPVVKEIASFEEKYADFLKMNNSDTAPVARKLDAAKRRLQEVATIAKNRVGEVRDGAEYDLKTAEEMIETAVNERRPLYFKPDGGVSQHLGSARDRLRLVRAVDADLAAPLVERYEAINAKASQAAASLKSEIIQSNRIPADQYRGSDADELKEGAKQAWLEANPDDEIVQIALVSSDWNRETKWTWWRDAFYFTDRSDMQAAVIVKGEGEDGSPELHRHSVNIRKNHAENDRLTYSPWEKQPAAEMPVESRILPENG